MHIKRIHEMVEKLTECTLSAINENKSFVGEYPIGDVVDMIKDLCEAEKSARIAKEMEKCEEEDKEEEKYLLKMLKEENKDEYKRYQDEYGEDADRRFYDSWRHADGTFARKGTGSYRPRSSGRRGRRGYEEVFIPLDYRMDMEDYTAYPPEYWRDMDRGMNRMYYSGGGSGGSSGGGQSGNSGGMGGSGMGGGQSSGGSSGGNSGGSRGYEEYQRGYSEGQNRGYEDGYREGERSGRGRGGNSRYDNARRGYEETKQNHKGNSPEDNSEKMKCLEGILNVVDGDMKEFMPEMSQSEKNMLKQKFMTWAQRIQ